MNKRECSVIVSVFPGVVQKLEEAIDLLEISRRGLLREDMSVVKGSLRCVNTVRSYLDEAVELMSSHLWIKRKQEKDIEADQAVNVSRYFSFDDNGDTVEITESEAEALGLKVDNEEYENG